MFFRSGMTYPIKIRRTRASIWTYRNRPICAWNRNRYGGCTRMPPRSSPTSPTISTRKSDFLHKHNRTNIIFFIIRCTIFLCVDAVLNWVNTFKSAVIFCGNSNDQCFLSHLYIFVFCDVESDLIEYFIIYSWRTFHELSSGDLFVNGDGLELICGLL
jgi:hypothetical protein